MEGKTTGKKKEEAKGKGCNPRKEKRPSSKKNCSVVGSRGGVIKKKNTGSKMRSNVRKRTVTKRELDTK